MLIGDGWLWCVEIQLKHICGKTALAPIRKEVCCRRSAPKLRALEKRFGEINRCKVLLTTRTKTCGYTVRKFTNETDAKHFSLSLSPISLSLSLSTSNTVMLSCNGLGRQHQPFQRLSNGPQPDLQTGSTLRSVYCRALLARSRRKWPVMVTLMIWM